MEEVFKRVKELKVKALDIIEEKMEKEISCDDLSVLIRCLTCIEEDKNFYNSALVKMIDNLNKKSFANMPKENETKSE